MFLMPSEGSSRDEIRITLRGSQSVSICEAVVGNVSRSQKDVVVCLTPMLVSEVPCQQNASRVHSQRRTRRTEG